MLTHIIWTHFPKGKNFNCTESQQCGEEHRSLSSQPQLIASQWQVCRLIRINVRQLLCDPAGLNHVSLGGFIRDSVSSSLVFCAVGVVQEALMWSV